MTRPHEETWEAWPGGEVHVVKGTCLNMVIDDNERAQLVAQAPAMARLLLDLHRDGYLRENGSRQCPVCHSTWSAEVTGKPYRPSHYDTCELVSIVHAAGVLPATL